MKEQLPLPVWGLRGQRVEQFGCCETLASGLHDHLVFLDHAHEFNPNQGVLGCFEWFESQHGPCHSFYTSMILLNGLSTNDKFCLIRQGRVKLRWSRRPYRFRPRKSDYAPHDIRHEESRHETPLADTAPIPADGGRSTTVGSGLPISSGLDGAPRDPRRFRPCPPTQTTDGGHV